MDQMQQESQSERNVTLANDLPGALARYRHPNHLRSVIELAITGIPFVALWVAAWWALSISFWLTLAISVPAGAFLMRLFLIKHDCGHGAFFRRRVFNDWIGRVLGVLTVTPYDVWRRSHAIHHATSGNLDKRGVGDVGTLTVREYRALSRLRRIAYHIYRNPLVMFGLGPAYMFLLRHRLPRGFSRGDRRFWISAMGTNVSIAVVVAAMIYILGVGPFLLVHLPITLIAGLIGVWLFYVQHQFEGSVWVEGQAWNFHDAALNSSSHYDLPWVLSWMTANIGVHHVHHLHSRIPFYRLPQVLRDHPELIHVKRLTLWKSLACVKFRLWDEGQRKLVSFSEARALPAE
ncbi:MAG: omega-6 fatty acid desaturase (delta-12 desaturase) [Alphaproteobacteria bacterium]|jgi:omega-6 fatty acid desaturase (delta-12 desaturase)